VELLGDYQDFISTRKLRLWKAESKEALYVRGLGAKKDVSYEDFREFAEKKSGEVVANIMICLIHQATYLLARQVDRLEADFLREGGLRERMTKARLAVRSGEARVEKKVRGKSKLFDGGK
jgi:four helix bundle suffix protein